MTRQYLIEIWSGDGCCFGDCYFGDCYHGDCYHGDHYKVAGVGVVFVFGPALLCAHQHVSYHSSHVFAQVLHSMAYCTQGSHRSYDLK